MNATRPGLLTHDPVDAEVLVLLEVPSCALSLGPSDTTGRGATSSSTDRAGQWCNARLAHLC